MTKSKIKYKILDFGFWILFDIWILTFGFEIPVSPLKILYLKSKYTTANPTKYAIEYHRTAKKPTENAIGLKFCGRC